MYSWLFSISCKTRKNGGKEASRKDGFQEESASECLRSPGCALATNSLLS